uniref:Uncharacterized protein n=1 Tax=Nymphaea colorata TaxID=210225 RepID=A0A5K1H030_9MAGN
MFAPVLGLAVPLSTPHPVVCGQFPNSQSPMMGSTLAVILIISPSPVYILAHLFLTMVVKNRAAKPSTKLQQSPTTTDFFALSGLLAPSSLLTLVETPKLREEGKM